MIAVGSRVLDLPLSSYLKLSRKQFLLSSILKYVVLPKISLGEKK